MNLTKRAVQRIRANAQGKGGRLKLVPTPEDVVALCSALLVAWEAAEREGAVRALKEST